MYKRPRHHHSRLGPACGAAATLLLLALSCASATAQSPTPAASAPAPALAKSKAEDLRITAIGEVVSIDMASRLVSVKGPRGSVGVYAIDERVKHLDQVKVGDRVRLDYRVGVALALRKGGDGIREKVESESAAVAASGTLPGAAGQRNTTVVANVLSVDRKRGLVKLKGPEGRVHDVHIQKPELIKDVKAGDQVVAVVTEAVALNVRPAPEAATKQ